MIGDADSAQDAVRVLDDPSYRDAAATAARSRALLNPPDVVLQEVCFRAGV